MNNGNNKKIKSFEPVADNESRVLILGTMPGEESLRQQQYYAHPRNLFWPIMFEVFEEKPQMEYTEKQNFLKGKRIALWDVFCSCTREGSLDSRIMQEELNEVAELINQRPNIRYIFCNGGMAFKTFHKRILPRINRRVYHLQLPSTSPANASVPYGKKLDGWLQIKYALEGCVLYRAVLTTQFGKLSIYSDGSSIVKIALPGSDEKPMADWAVFNEDALCEVAGEQIQEYMNGKRQVFCIPVRTGGTAFQERVYRVLKNIPYGATISYGELAARSGTPKGARAVGQAVRKNPVPILIPCHRVIGTHGKNIGFMGVRNNPLQNMFLELEKRTAPAKGKK